jgi:hypothetical protein
VVTPTYTHPQPLGYTLGSDDEPSIQVGTGPQSEATQESGVPVSILAILAYHQHQILLLILILPQLFRLLAS